MSRIQTRGAIVALACALVGGGAIASPPDEVKVEALRVVKTQTVGHSTAGIPIVDISLSYGVSIAGLDLSTSSGATELERRVTEAAQAACKEIGSRHPDSTPADTECAKIAADKAMPKARQVIAAAQKPTISR